MNDDTCPHCGLKKYEDGVRNCCQEGARDEYSSRFHAVQKRRQLLPLRLAVNRALKATGIPHAKRHLSGQISGLHHVSDGWETESHVYGDYVSVCIWTRRTRNSAEAQEKMARYTALTAEALKPFKYTVEQDGTRFVVTDWTDEARP